MSMSDPVSDMLTRIRNGQSATKQMVAMPNSAMKVSIANVLKDNDIVILRSTVKIGTTRNIVFPILKKYSMDCFFYL